MTTQCVQVRLEFGHSASIRDMPGPDGFTHDWGVFVRGSEGNHIHHFVEKVVFNLHDSFPKPRRVIKEPPFQLDESGYGGFTLPIEVYLKNKEEPKKVQFMYDLFLHVEGEPPVDNCKGEKLTFRNPTEDFRRKLLLAGGVGVLDDGGIPPGAAFGLESMGTINTTGAMESRTASKGKPGSLSANVPQKKLKTGIAPTKDPKNSSSSKVVKESKEGKVSSKESKTGERGRPKLAGKRPSTSTTDNPIKRKKEHSNSTKTPKTKKSSAEKLSVSSEQSTKKATSATKKKKSLPSTGSVKKDKKADLFTPEIIAEHKTIEPVIKPTLPPFEDELSTGEVGDGPDSPSSKSTGSFSSLPRGGGGAGGALETLMAEIDDDDEDEEEYMPFRRSFVDNDGSSYGSDNEQVNPPKLLKKESSTPTKRAADKHVVKKETKYEKKSKVETKSKTGETKKGWTKQKEGDNKNKVPDVKKKTGNDKNKSSSMKNKTLDKKAAKLVETKTKSPSEAKVKKTEKPKVESKKRSVDGKSSKVIEGKSKSETKIKSVDGKFKETAREIEKRGSGTVPTNSMDYLYELVDLHKRLMALKDREKLQKVVDLIGETGEFKITDKTFDFDLCSLDKPTVKKLQEYVPPL